MAMQLQIRRDTAANWTTKNPILAQGEIGFETDTNKFKWGDGATAWTSLSYFGIGSGVTGVSSFNTRTGAVTSATNDYTWAQVNKATSNIADITTKSHTSLTDIGTNTHVQIDTFIASKGASLGLATLDGGGKVPASELPATLLVYLGTWNASTNTPTLSDATGTGGDVYIVTVAGTQNLGSGAQTFAIGDWVMHNGSIWEKSINSNAVASVNGYTGVVTLAKSDVGLSNVSNDAQLKIASNLSDLANTTTARTNLGVAIGTNVQAYSSVLDTYAGISPSANVQTLLGSADYAAFKTSLSLNNVENTALSTWVGTANITTLGTITTGSWTATSIATAYTDAKLKTLTGTLDRVTIGGTATDPTADIASTYVGQTSIMTLGTIGTGTWQGTAIADTYIASAATWNAKQAALTFSTGLTNTANTITNNLSVGISGGQKVVGGTGVTDILKLQGTTGNGTLTSAAIQLLVGNNGATNALTVLNNGNVGIGTTTPGALLDVNGRFRVNTIGTAPTSGAGVEIYGGTVPEIIAYNRSTSAYLQLDLNDSMYVNGGSGNVGIGTTAPGKLLSTTSNLWQVNSNGIQWNNSAKTTYTGSITGTANWSMPFQGSAYKKFVINMQALHDVGGTITFPTAFTTTPFVYGDAAALAISSATTTTFTIAAAGTITGNVFVEGF